jgi:Transposase DDE domain group 1
MSKTNRQSVLFEGLTTKPVVTGFDADAMSSDGGLLLLATLDRGIQLSARLASKLSDQRDPGRVSHSYLDLFRHRMLGIVAGYVDGNDAQQTAGDPMMKMAIGRVPVSGSDLASQPTLSRFENGVSAKSVVAAIREMETVVIERLARRHRKAKVVTIDVDSTVDPTHGNQQLTFFSGYYGTWCYHPLLAFLSVDGDPQQYLFHARLRPGNCRDPRGLVPMLRRTIAAVRQKFGKVKIRVRVDAGFYRPHLLDVLEGLGVEYVVSMQKNKALDQQSAKAMAKARRQAKRSKETATLFEEFDYAAKSWPNTRRVVCKAEVLVYPGRNAKDNQRYVVTNRTRPSAESIYKWYCERGDSENRIKELKHDLAIDRTSCPRFVANQLRVLMTAAAFVLFQELRWRLRNNEAGRSTVASLRNMLIKVAVRVTESVRRIVCHMPARHAWRDLWRSAARACGAAPA